jgi:hypothetical protein
LITVVGFEAPGPPPLLHDSKLAAARRTRGLLLAEARREADALRRETDLQAKEDAARLGTETQRGIDARRAATTELELRLRREQEDVARRIDEASGASRGHDREVHAKHPEDPRRRRSCMSSSAYPGSASHAKAEMLSRSGGAVCHELAGDTPPKRLERRTASRSQPAADV